MLAAQQIQLSAPGVNGTQAAWPRQLRRAACFKNGPKEAAVVSNLTASRRGRAANIAGRAVSLEQPPPSTSETGDRSHETDVVVIGSGIGGALWQEHKPTTAWRRPRPPLLPLRHAAATDVDMMRNC